MQATAELPPPSADKKPKAHKAPVRSPGTPGEGHAGQRPWPPSGVGQCPQWSKETLKDWPHGAHTAFKWKL